VDCHRIPGMNADDLKRHAATVGVVSKGELIAAMACGGKERGNVEITFAADSPKWATRGDDRQADALAVRSAGLPSGDDAHCRVEHRAIRFNEGIGFKREGVIREGWGPGEDAILLGLVEGRSS
jgi:hypothetical protein